MTSDFNDEEEGHVVKLRGLPWSTTVGEIYTFFSDCNIKNGKLGIQMTLSREGRPSGEAYVEMMSEDDVEKACKRDRDHMGHRYIEVFKAKRSEMEWVVKRSGLLVEDSADDACIRLRGLPFGCAKDEIAKFFEGLEIVPNGISVPTDYMGRSSGEAYVQFENKEMAEKAMEKHKEKIGHRYIEIFRSSLAEVRAAISPKMRPMVSGPFSNRPAPYDRNDRFGGANRFNNMGRGSGPAGRSFMKNEYGGGYNDDGPGPWGRWGNGGGMGGGPGSMRGGGGGMGGGMGMKPSYGGPAGPGMNRNGSWSGGGGGGGGVGGHNIHMRGLPFRATQSDIAEFFRPLVPVSIRLVYDNSGRASGEADVEFASHEDAVKAMSKDKSNMQHRYIELFLNSSPSPPMGGGGGGGGGGGFSSMGGGGGGFGGGSGGFGESDSYRSQAYLNSGPSNNFSRGFSGGGDGGMGFNSPMGGGGGYNNF